MDTGLLTVKVLSHAMRPMNDFKCSETISHFDELNGNRFMKGH